MPCDTIRDPRQTSEQRIDQIKRAIAKLDAQIASGQVTLKVGPTGAVAFIGSILSQDKISDVCAFRKLQVAGSASLRMALAKAEAMAGRKADVRTQAMSGTHLHGDTWHHGH